jgi:hypothetical protein
MSPKVLWDVVRAAATRAGMDKLESHDLRRAPHGRWRSISMFRGLRQIDYDLIGWGWMLWDVDPLRRRVADPFC